jgi:RNA polymerase sigma-70 factor, ECF subfamily
MALRVLGIERVLRGRYAARSAADARTIRREGAGALGDGRLPALPGALHANLSAAYLWGAMGRDELLLLENNRSAALSIALAIVRDPAEAEDVVQDTFLEAVRRHAEYDPGRGATRAWIASIARSRAIDHLRGLARISHLEALTGDGTSPPASNLFEERQRHHRLRSALTELPAAQRQAIELAFFHELPYREVALRLGVPEGTIKGRIRLGLSHLSKVLGDA